MKAPFHQVVVIHYDSLVACLVHLGNCLACVDESLLVLDGETGPRLKSVRGGVQDNLS